MHIKIVPTNTTVKSTVGIWHPEPREIKLKPIETKQKKEKSV